MQKIFNLVFFLSFALAGSSQSFLLNDQGQYLDNSKIDVLVLDELDNDALLNEEMALRKPGRAPKFAVNIPVNITPSDRGSWEEIKPGLKLWRFKIVSPDAKSLNFGFGQFVLPPSASLYIYSPNSKDLRGPFTPLDNDIHEQLWTPIIHSDELVIALTIAEEDIANLKLRLDYINHDFMGFGKIASSIEKSGSCNVDVVCGAADGYPQNDNHRDIMRSVAVISLGGGTFCTGFLVNNTAQDEKPYFMTADHCEVNAAQAPSLVTYWLFENSTCRTPGSAASGGAGDGMLNIFNTGSVLRAEYATSDMTLLELDDPVNPNANAYFAGWRNDNTLPTSSIAIHHPSTDEKRISYENQASCSTSYSSNNCGVGNTHVRVADWDIGTTEGGSSGSPLFDQNEYVVGQLHGGGAACGNNQPDWYGWFHVSWTGGGTNSSRLSNWLDSGNTGATTLSGLDTNNQGGGNYTCANAEVITQPGSFMATAPDQGNGASQGDATHATWYSFTPQSSGQLTIRSCDGGIDTRLWIWDGTCGNLNQVGAGDDDCQMGPGLDNWASEVVNLAVNAGTTLYIEWDDRFSPLGFTWMLEYSGSCPSSYTGANGNALSGVQNSSMDFETNGAIESTQTISGNMTNVDYDSGVSILLNADFEVLQGAVFDAFIDGCGGALARESQDPGSN